MLSQNEIEFYRENGYLMVENAVTPAQLNKLRAITHELIERPIRSTKVMMSAIWARVTVRTARVLPVSSCPKSKTAIAGTFCKTRT
jgi:hypothetical protein